ncbi:hypothetical protein [Acidianus sp. HS-5]|uniref:hypothetical protein n=1 Tax=Acidianus sp. HS-5 TaxID=2886040 RepID=UPI001F3606B3|nr:hypothetical protein [Acidianus sp. HS-5]BDC17432.1 hypothetical protein HS5_03220 [Acidianus sp. HS-5]
MEENEVKKLRELLKEHKVRLIFTSHPEALLGPYSRSIIACGVHLVENLPNEVWERFLQYFGINSNPDVVYINQDKDKYKIVLLKYSEVEEFLVNQCTHKRLYT